MAQLPRQIQAQIDAVEAAYATPAPNSPALAPTPAPVVEAPAPQPVVEPVAAPATAPVAAPQPPAPDPWEHRYKSLQGMFNSRMQQSDELIASLRAELAAARTPAQQPAPEPSPVDPKDAETFGADLMEAVIRVVTNKLSPVIRGFDERLQAMETAQKSQGSLAAQTAEDVFWNTLYAKVPDLDAVNTREDWIEWLKLKDPASGVIRQQLLNAATQQYDTDRVVAIIDLFRKEFMGDGAAPAAPVAPAPNPASALAKQVSPQSSGAPAAPPPGPRRIKQAEVLAFYDRARRGEYRGRDDEYLRLESMYNDALAKGLID